MRRKLAAFATSASLLGLMAVPSTTSTAQELPQWPEVGSARVVPLQETGPASERLNLIVMCDGYQAHEMDKCAEDVDRNQNVQWATEPFRSYRNYFNVYRLEIVSGESGVRCDPDEEGGPDPFKITPLRMVFSNGCVDPLARGTVYNNGGGRGGGSDPGVSPTGAQQRTFYLETYVAPALGIPADSQNLQTLAIFNTFTYGGIGGTHATTSGGSPQGPLISLHELGHSLGNLQDEYPYRSRPNPGGPWCDPEETDPDDNDFCDEPGSIHHTRMTSEEMIENEAKWWRWLGEESLSGGIIRAADPDGYEGGQYRSSEIWRSSEHSMMRWIGFPLDQVGREHMAGRITGLRDANEMPLDHAGRADPNVASAAAVSCSYTSPWESCSAINDGIDPPQSDDGQNPRWGTWPEGGDQWIELTWDEPQQISVSDIYWFQDSADGSNSGVKRPAQWSIQYWDGEQYVDVTNPSGYGTELDQYNRTSFDAVTTTTLRANVKTRADAVGVGALEWKVYTEAPTGEGPQVGPEDVVWLETMHPRFHEMDVTWEINGETVTDAQGSSFLELAELDVEEGDTVRVTVADPTEFVRDPSLAEGPRMTQVRDWTVGEPLPADPVGVKITGSTPTERGALAGDEVVYVETTHPTDRVFDVTWELDGELVPNPDNSRTLDLGELDLSAGNVELTAMVTDPADPDGASDTVTWTVDNVLPTAPRTLSEPLATLNGDVEHNVYFNEFDMLLEPRDNTEGFVVGEFQLNGDGYFNYFGFPEEPFGTPFNFSHSGKDVKALTYGNLGTGGLSKATFEQSFTDEDPTGPFVPGLGTHTVEHRAIDAAGNVGGAEEFRASVLPGELLECTRTISGTHRGNVRVTSGVTCLDGATVSGGVTVLAGGSLLATDSSINGSLSATAAEAVQLFGSMINGDTEIAGTATDVTTAGNTFHGSVVLTGNNQEQANEQFFQFGYEYGPILSGNTVNGELQCTGNSAPARDFEAPNKISGTAGGDCAAL